MIGIVLVSHANIAKEMLGVIEHIVGPQERIKQFQYFQMTTWRKKIRILDSVKKVDAGKGVIVLTDMFGGTPSNLAISVMEDEKIEVVAGVNLPMLIKMMSIREKKTIKELIKISQESGRKYINVASAFFEEKNIWNKKK